MEIIVLHQFGSTVFQNLRMDAASLELPPDSPCPRFSLIKGSCYHDLPKLSVQTKLKTRERENSIENPTVALKLLTTVDEPSRSKERLYEVEYPIGAAIRPLLIEKNLVETAPLGGFARSIYKTTSLKYAGDIASRPALSKKSCERIYLIFRKRRH